jgi:hypothetical protein
LAQKVRKFAVESSCHNIFIHKTTILGAAARIVVWCTNSPTARQFVLAYNWFNLLLDFCCCRCFFSGVVFSSFVGRLRESFLPNFCWYALAAAAVLYCFCWYAFARSNILN